MTKNKKLRGRLLSRGLTVAEFAAKSGFKIRTVKAAMRGERKGPLSLQILEAIRND